ncbi:MAG: hypothetical protein NC393_10365 [Clostridium sp.]|nr:hypothetical protein [Clostridium sp.]MCM1207506.1 hypothetical protein [Ruminococcus sp.]
MFTTEVAKNLVTEEMVVCGTTALTYNGMTTYSSPHLRLMTQYKELDGCDVVFLSYYYYTYIDRVNWIRHDVDNPLILIPSRERAIIDYLMNERWCDEGVAIDALKDYLNNFCDMSELYRVADFYKYSKETLDYWLEEARNDCEV